ncbi:hypothetical protein JX266_008309 [Neoarthrinium moseri]|uniref:uncharacterized protein n=1 Tax=Neoarthrinium moseri TaxID=1658444 RepID=UPI001FDE149E|nr:uncharacterized protein JN550_009925 [Neoarthrinium moseri]KAI1845451.1 hypothetical protein JX266_008309 [Neoarthrinium moseri]KAI1862778.1 hypothetical protein JN550_009925 [Neoarthrinium moseri]
MKSATVLTTLGAILSFGAQTVVSTCYKSGDDLPDKAQAIAFITDACRGNNGMFTGAFGPLQTKSMCPNSHGVNILFEVQNLNGVGNYDLDDNECITRLGNEINACSRGGESTIASWRFRVDPGNC